MSRKHTGCRAALQALLADRQPETLLCIGSGCRDLVPEGRQTRLITGDDPLGALAEAGRFDFALVVGGLEALPKATGQQLLARLRDLHGGHFAVQLPPQNDCDWSDNDLRAMGLILLARCGEQERPFRIFGFDLRTYKPTPDWLNPKFWAHPERWNRFYW